MSFASARLPGFAAAALIALAVPVHAENAAKPNYPAVPLIATGKTTIGETIRYPQGEAHITASIVTLAPGARTIAHRHGVPMFAYILEGEITVDYGAHGKRTYRKGDALMWANTRPDGAIDHGTRHAGLPPIAGEKWVLSQWLRGRAPNV